MPMTCNLYLVFISDCPEDLECCKNTIEQCVRSIDNWMLANKLKLNHDKTELLFFSSKYRVRPPFEPIHIGDLPITPTSSARNLFDQCFNLEEGSVCKSLHYQIRNIAKLRKYLTEESAKIVVHALVISKLRLGYFQIGYCNSLLYGLPKHLLSRLQSVQNAAAKIIKLWGAGMAQWLIRVRFPDSASYVGWVCCWFSSLLREVFLRVLRFSPLLKNQHFQIPIRSGLLSSTLSWASGSGDCASTPRVIDIK